MLKRVLRKGSSLSLQERRADMDRNAKRFKDAAGVACQNVNINRRAAQWLIPDGAMADTAVLYLHGGAYTVGSPNSHRALASHIAKASQVRVLLLDYRLAPEHPFPAAVEDALNAFAWMQRTLKLYANRIIIAGDSAGGGLTVATALRLRDTGLTLPRALVCLSPWTDLTLSGETVNRLSHKDPFFPTPDRLKEAASAYAAKRSLSTPEISPLFADLRGLPELYIQVGSDEILLSDSLELAKAAKKAGVHVRIEEWPGMWHVWQVFCNLMPESREAISKIGNNIRTALATSAPSNQ